MFSGKTGRNDSPGSVQKLERQKSVEERKQKGVTKHVLTEDLRHVKKKPNKTKTYENYVPGALRVPLCHCAEKRGDYFTALPE